MESSATLSEIFRGVDLTGVFANAMLRVETRARAALIGRTVRSDAGIGARFSSVRRVLECEQSFRSRSPTAQTLASCVQTDPMAISRLNPERLHRTAGYAHVTLVDSGRLAMLAGQCPLDHDESLVGRGDILRQVDQIAANATEALAAAGTSAENVIRSVIYVVSDDSSVLSSVWDRLTGSIIGPAFKTASTLLGVAALGYRDQLVEVDLTAALPD